MSTTRKPMKREQEERMRAQGFITVAETARLAGVNRQTVNLWIDKSHVESITVGQRIYIVRDSLAEYLGPVGAKALLAGT